MQRYDFQQMVCGLKMSIVILQLSFVMSIPEKVHGFLLKLNKRRLLESGGWEVFTV